MIAMLLAADDGLIRILIAILVIGGFIVRVLAKLREAAQPPKPLPRRRPVPAEMENEIEEFLRRAGKQREEAPKRPATIAQDLGRRAPPPRLPQTPVVAEVVDEDVPSGEKVAEHVEKHLDSEKIARRTAQLGTDVAMADEHIDEHLQQAFGHDLGRLGRKRGKAGPPSSQPARIAQASAAPVATPTAEGLAMKAFIADIHLLRQAIVMNEILRRPEERWD